MTITEQKTDLFLVPQGYYLAHCISGDYALGAGIAKTFDEVYDMKFKLFKEFDVGDCTELIGSALLIDNVFNLVTKARCFNKPTYESLTQSVSDMKRQCEFLSIRKLAMPLIGCGLDRLQWDKVKAIIEETFRDMDIDILICVL